MLTRFAARFVCGVHPCVVILALPLLFAALPLACCPPGPFEYERGYQQADSPEMAYTMMREAVLMEGPEEADGQRIFYYLLSKDVRAEFPFWQVQQGWGRIKEELGIDVGLSRLLRVEFLEESPFPPRPAARVVVEYPHPEEGVVVESFLMLLELDTRTYFETMPQWRVLYPYEPYQRAEARMWFQELQEIEPEEQETEETPHGDELDDEDPPGEAEGDE